MLVSEQAFSRAPVIPPQDLVQQTRYIVILGCIQNTSVLRMLLEGFSVGAEHPVCFPIFALLCPRAYDGQNLPFKTLPATEKCGGSWTSTSYRGPDCKPMAQVLPYLPGVSDPVAVLLETPGGGLEPVAPTFVFFLCPAALVFSLFLSFFLGTFFTNWDEAVSRGKINSGASA